MKLLIGASLVAAAVARTSPGDLLANDYSYTLENLMEEFDLLYTEDEMDERRQIFQDNLQKIKRHNAGKSSYTMSVNQFAALTPKEFKAFYSGYKPAHTDDFGRFGFVEADLSGHVDVESLPAELDWRTKQVVTPVKNQGGCGSCWAFSATETVESNVAINTGTLLELAPQQYVDCVENPRKCGGTGGCEGATQWLAFNYSIGAGLTTEKNYPYKGRDTACTQATPAVSITGYTRLPQNNYTALMNAVATVGPIAVSAAAEPWQLYFSGVYDGNCGADVDHAIQLVGYGTVRNKDYWLVRNSWGASWGDKGYILLERFGATGQEKCYTDKTPQDGTECAGGPKEIQVCGLCGIMSDSSYVVGGALAK
jgi:cathepsin L